MQIAVLDDAGVVHYGQILPGREEGRGFSGDGAMATVEFRHGAEKCSRRVSAVPVTDASATELQDDYPGNLRWFFNNCGDCNQDGLVSATDLTPIGFYYGQACVEINEYSSWTDSSARSIVDTNRDHHITVSDITAIGQNFGNSILGGYNVYESADPADYPQSNDGINGPGANVISSVALDETSVTDPINARKYYNCTVADPDTTKAYWVRPVDEHGNEGTPSNFIIQIGLEVARTDDSAAVLEWDGGASSLNWGYSLVGDTNQDGLINVPDLTRIGYHYDCTGPFDAGTIESVVDCNDDDIINVLDIFAIEQHFDERFGGYAVFASSDPEDYPVCNDAVPVIEPVLLLPAGSRTYPFPDCELASQRMMSCEIETPVSGTYYWVRLIDWFGLYGTPSNIVQIP